MRVLWVTMGGLWPLNTGGRLRSFHMVSELARTHQVVLVTTEGPHNDADGLAANMPDCERIAFVPYTAPRRGSWRFMRALVRSWFSPLPVDLSKWRAKPMQRLIRSLLNGGGFDVVVADFLVAVPNVPRDRGVPVLFFAHNVEHVIWQRLRDVEARWSRRLLLEVEWRKMRRSETRACAEATLTV